MIKMGKHDKHTISILVENKTGVLQRVAGLFTRRDFNIDNITVGKTANTKISRITITTYGDNNTLEQIIKQLNKLIEVIKVREMKPENTLRRQLALLKIHAPKEQDKAEIIQYVNIFRGHIIDVTPKTITVEITGNPDKINALMNLLRPYGIKETAKTGITAIGRGQKTL
ncbi:MAG: acetolactate synthase small subunit [Methanosphaera sp.]|nr:acetolactate synthase small subunit [Methanosphaera sp. ISO3-F5]MBR0472394.1 acetolactate synthase small subunit [Methanosphaera sp.]WQH64925.1 acetolactate synthase small subunit [Methanosphaera sp. ISO3-F5]